MPRTKKVIEEPSMVQRIQSELQLNQSYVSLVLGLLIVLVAGILLFNYFKGSQPTLGPAQQTEEAQGDVEPGNLPGKYTVKEGDTLFTIAEKYYNDGYKFNEISKANNLSNENSIQAGQVLEIPKLESTEAVAEATPTTNQEPTPTETVAAETAVGGAENQTIWGEKISSDTYTVVEGDWLSTIAGRAYGDVMSYKKLAEANNIANPDLILPGQVIKIPH